MDKYDKLMQEIVAYLQGTRLAKAPEWEPGWGPISGSSESEIEEAEKQVGKKIPAALEAWYRAAGKIPPYFYDYDMDYSLQDFLRAQETAVELTTEDGAEWALTDTMLPFSQRIGEQFLFVDIALGELDDPPVFHSMDGDAPKQVSVAFSCYIRETWLQAVDPSILTRENNLEVHAWPADEEDPWAYRRRVMNQLIAEARAIRRQFIEKLHDEDLARGEITGPREFEERFLKAFANGEL